MRLFPVPDADEAAIARRRRNEEERRERIFDPKMRIKGVDFDCVKEQIVEKIEKKNLERERELIFAKHSQDINEFLDKLEKDVILQRKVEQYKLKDAREAQYRDDPLVPRVEIDDPHKHVSSLQSFLGDDLDAEERFKKQKEQRKVWAQQQVWEREQAKRMEQEQERQYKEYQDSILKALSELELKQKALMKEKLKRDMEHNKKLNEEQKRVKEEEEANLNTFDIETLHNSRLGHMILEKPTQFGTKGNVLVAEYKGMTEDQLKKIRDSQQQQRKEKEERAAAWKKEELDYAQYQNDVLQLQDLLEKKKQQLLREQTKTQFKVNDMLAEQKRVWADKEKAQKNVYEPQPFFSVFNQSSR